MTKSSNPIGQPEVYTPNQLEKIVKLVKEGVTVKAAIAILNQKEGLKYKYTPLLVAAIRHGISFRTLKRVTKKKGIKFIAPQKLSKEMSPKELDELLASIEEKLENDDKPRNSKVKSSSSLVAALKELARLKAEGVLTEREFSRAKAKVIGE